MSKEPEAQTVMCGECPFDGLAIDVVVWTDSITKTLDQVVAEYKTTLENDTSSQVLAEEHRTLLSGIEAIRIHTSSPFGDGVTLVVIMNSYIFLLGSHLPFKKTIYTGIA
ncbi:MAG: hypothetical protein A2Z14_11050 [Chloroflexi bacterium RBG_16_48_8]|nr:MAG: hypothetical protein A2Z14_11050 [Chloroflexi bacterium RBG_16_48_8]